MEPDANGDELDDIEQRFGKALDGPTPLSDIKVPLSLLFAFVRRERRIGVWLNEQVSTHSDLLCGKQNEMPSKPGILHALSELQQQMESSREERALHRKILVGIAIGVATGVALKLIDLIPKITNLLNKP